MAQPVSSEAFQKLMASVNTVLTPSTYSLANVAAGLNIDPLENEDANKLLGGPSQVKRVGRTLPNLIFAIEDFERNLIALSRAGAQADL